MDVNVERITGLMEDLDSNVKESAIMLLARTKEVNDEYKEGIINKLMELTRDGSKKVRTIATTELCSIKNGNWDFTSFQLGSKANSLLALSNINIPVEMGVTVAERLIAGMKSTDWNEKFIATIGVDHQKTNIPDSVREKVVDELLNLTKEDSYLRYSSLMTLENLREFFSVAERKKIVESLKSAPKTEEGDSLVRSFSNITQTDLIRDRIKRLLFYEEKEKALLEISDIDTSNIPILTRKEILNSLLSENAYKLMSPRTVLSILDKFKEQAASGQFRAIVTKILIEYADNKNYGIKALAVNLLGELGNNIPFEMRKDAVNIILEYMELSKNYTVLKFLHGIIPAEMQSAVISKIISITSHRNVEILSGFKNEIPPNCRKEFVEKLLEVGAFNVLEEYANNIPVEMRDKVISRLIEDQSPESYSSLQVLKSIIPEAMKQTVIDKFMNGVSSKNAEVRDSAIINAAKLRDYASLEFIDAFLAKILKIEEISTVRAIEDLNIRIPAHTRKDCINFILKFMRNKNQNIKIYSALALGNVAMIVPSEMREECISDLLNLGSKEAVFSLGKFRIIPESMKKRFVDFMLSEISKERDEKIKVSAIEAVSQMKEYKQEIIKELLKLEKDSPAVVVTAVSTLTALVSPETKKDIVDFLFKVGKRRDQNIRITCCNSLSILRPMEREKEVKDFLLNLFADTIKVVNSAINAIRVFPKYRKDEDIKASLLTLKEENVKFALEANLIKKESIREKLLEAIDLTEDRDFMRRCSAIQDIKKFHLEEFRNVIFEKLMELCGDSEYCVRHSSVQALKELGFEEEVARVEIVEDEAWKDPGAIYTAASIYEISRDKEKLDRIVELTYDENPDIRNRAVEVLNSLSDEIVGDERKLIVESFIKLSDDANPLVRNSAMIALSNYDVPEKKPMIIQRLMR